MRIAVTGKVGQLAASLAEAGPAAGVEIIAVGRPELDLAQTGSIAAALRAARPDAIVSAAAYTAVDKAESEPELAFAVNAAGAGAVALEAAELGVPVIHLSTDYVFNGRKTAPYVESDPTDPINVYGASKLAGEAAVAAAADHVILRASWVYAPFGANFVKTMLRLAETRDLLRVVDDQIGRPTYAPDIASAVIGIARRLTESGDPALRGVFHLAPSGQTSWAGFAKAIFAGAQSRGMRPISVEPIRTIDYPTPARRPVNSRLSGEKLAEIYGITLPDWRESLSLCLDRLMGSRSGAA